MRKLLLCSVEPDIRHVKIHVISLPTSLGVMDQSGYGATQLGTRVDIKCSGTIISLSYPVEFTNLFLFCLS